MLELPEIARLAEQGQKELVGRQIACVSLGDKPHKFLFKNKEEEEIAFLLTGTTIRRVWAESKWLHLECEPGAVFSFNEMGGQIRFVEDGRLPMKAHFLMRFSDGSALFAMVQMWGFIQAVREEEFEEARRNSFRQGPPVLSKGFTREFYRQALAEWPDRNKKSIKALFVGCHAGTGLGNGYLQDILFTAGVHPTRKVVDLSPEEVDRLYDATVEVTRQSVELGGRDTERDLYGNPGGYRPILDKRCEAEPCPRCGTPIQKISYLGGSCYVCPSCQQ